MLGAGLTLWVLFSHVFKPDQQKAMEVNMTQIGEHLLSLKKEGFVLPFEVISILLLATMIAAIIIAKHDEKTKSEDI